MAGYPGTPLPQKLGIKAGARLALLRAPADFKATLGGPPDGVRMLTSARAPLDVAVCFCTSSADVAARFPRLAAALAPAGGLWIA